MGINSGTYVQLVYSGGLFVKSEYKLTPNTGFLQSGVIGVFRYDQLIEVYTGLQY